MASDKDVYIIAEAGVNHNGDFGRALEMITVAKSSKADAIKFQTAVPEEVATKSAQKADYQKEKTRNHVSCWGLFFLLKDRSSTCQNLLSM